MSNAQRQPPRSSAGHPGRSGRHPAAQCPVPGASSWFPAHSAWGQTDGEGPTEAKICVVGFRKPEKRMAVVVECLLPPACALLGVSVFGEPLGAAPGAEGIGEETGRD